VTDNLKRQIAIKSVFNELKLRVSKNWIELFSLFWHETQDAIYSTSVK